MARWAFSHIGVGEISEYPVWDGGMVQLRKNKNEQEQANGLLVIKGDDIVRNISCRHGSILETIHSLSKF